MGGICHHIALCHLGFTIGPAAGAHRWETTITKWVARTRNLAAQELPTKMVLEIYKQRSLSILSHVSMLTDPPKKLEATKRLQGILPRMPGSTLYAHDMADLAAAGGCTSRLREHG